MNDKRIKTVVIVGGGTAGWMAAAALVHRFGPNRQIKITVVESNAIGTVGVGEATVPQMREFLKRLKIDEVDFVRQTNATFKLAIAFDGWAGAGTRFMHPFADHGAPILGAPFQHHWTKLHKLGLAQCLDDYCLASGLAQAGKFALPRPGEASGMLPFNYAFHFDATLVAAYLKRWALGAGVQRVEGTIVKVARDRESGDVAALALDDGRTVEGEFFIDCSGFRGLLIEETLETGFDDWSHWLPCDRAAAIPCRSSEAPMPYTRSLASRAGWQWRIPLQHRVGNGHVYCSAFISDEDALKALEAELQGPALAEPRLLRFTTGMRRRTWNHNVFALGLAAGFLEPLESTSIYLVQKGLSDLINNFPTRVDNPVLRDEVNRRSREHWQHIRDFIILHYALNGRVGEPFWDACRRMPLPDSLAEAITLFRHTGRVREMHAAFFRHGSWLSIFAGLGVVPDYYHPAVDDIDQAALEQELRNMASGVSEAVAGAPDHTGFIRSNCAAPASAAA